MTDVDEDEKLDDFIITCRKCGSNECVTYRHFYPEMAGECKVICRNCGKEEWCIRP